MNTTINHTNYDILIEGGDIVLQNEEHDVVIEGGYFEMTGEAIGKVGHHVNGFRGSELEYSKEELDCYIEDNIQDFVKKHYLEGRVTKW
jgi:hypothetical protein